MVEPEDHPKLPAVYSAKGPEESRKLYDAWADTYESSFIEKRHYIYHRRVAEIFVEEFGSRSGVILDAGCGTGAIGVELSALGVNLIDGIDISTEMLARAETKTGQNGPVYRHLLAADLTQPIDVGDSQYAGIVSAGAFTHGHLGPGTLKELIRVATTGALCVIGINSAHFFGRGFGDYLNDLVDSGGIADYRIVSAKIYQDSDDGDPDQMAAVSVFTVV